LVGRPECLAILEILAILAAFWEPFLGRTARPCRTWTPKAGTASTRLVTIKEREATRARARGESPIFFGRDVAWGADAVFA